MENTGIIFKEQELDYVAGAIPYEVICADWTSYLPSDEMQIGLYFDTMACVTFSATNVVETQMNFMFMQGVFSLEACVFFEAGGWLINGKFNFSDRFTAKMSNTTKDGNYLQAVWDSIKHHGLLPEADWAYPRRQRTPVFDWDDYYKEIPQDLKDKALKILDYIDVAYEWTVRNQLTPYTNNEILELKRELKQAPLQLAASTCKWGGDVILACGKTTASHATMIYKIDDYIYDFDSYDPYRKKLAMDYLLLWVLKGVITLKNNPIIKNDMRYVKNVMGEQYLLDEQLMLKLNIGDNIEREALVKRGLVNQPEVVTNEYLEAFESYALVRKSRMATQIGIIRDLQGL